MSSTPSYQFDAYVTKQNGGWKATINKTLFPFLTQNTSNKTIHLNEEKYKHVFSSFLLLCETLPSNLFDYTVCLDEDNVVITGLTETTVRVAIVDLVSSFMPDASVKMVKPPINFRVYSSQKQPAVENVDCFGDVGCFFDNGDY